MLLLHRLLSDLTLRCSVRTRSRLASKTPHSCRVPGRNKRSRTKPSCMDDPSQLASQETSSCHVACHSVLSVLSYLTMRDISLIHVFHSYYASTVRIFLNVHLSVQWTSWLHLLLSSGLYGILYVEAGLRTQLHHFNTSFS